MVKRNHIKALLNEVNSIHRAEILVKGVLNGLLFARECGGRIATIQTKREEWLLQTENGYAPADHDYQQGQLIGLEHALHTIENTIANPQSLQPSELFPDQVQFDLNWQQIFVAGIQDALVFGREHQNHIPEIAFECEATRDRLTGTDFSCTTKGEYQRGYLVGLEMAMNILTKASS